MKSDSAGSAVYDLLVGKNGRQAGSDMSEDARRAQPRNFLTHVASLGATKASDGLADPKLVLSWLFGALGVPAYLVGLLVPLREAGALLPQLFISARLQRLPQRKWVWAAGSLVQGACAIGMAVVALTLDGVAAGWCIVALLAVLAIARSVCSVSYKDVLGKTVAKATRGTATGSAATVAAIAVLTFGALLTVGIIERSVGAIAVVLIIAGVLWMVAATLFSTLVEPASSQDGQTNEGLKGVLRQFSLLRQDRQLRLFIIARGLLTATALAPPFLLALAGRAGENEIGALGPFIIASALAGAVSTYAWGRLADRSSRKVLALAGIAAAAVLGVSAALAFAAHTALSVAWVAPVLLFVLVVAHQGVRLGRSTHLVDMADAETRAAYTALSNTIIGVLLLAGGVFGVVAHVAGEATVLAIFAVMSLGAVPFALKLDEVQQKKD